MAARPGTRRLYDLWVRPECRRRLIELCDCVDYVTQDMVISILGDEEGHRCLFEGFLRGFKRG